jgi:serine/threonine-protein phosphatase 2A regulatory subunit B'
VLENSWPHLQIVYEFLLRFIVSSDVDHKAAKKYVSHSFILQLLGLFDSEDPRERDYLKTILHRIYGKFMALRAFIRKSIINVFLSSTYLEDHNNGIAELLEILGSIINGYALPLKAEHKRFLDKGLIPLHKVRSINAFHQQLEYCITQYVEKDNEMAEPVILGLLKFWPEMNSPKQALFLHELEEVLELTRADEFRNIIKPLFKRLALCIDSQHFQVAERTLLLWNNEYLFTLMMQNRQEVLPLVYKVLKANSDEHWNATVQTLSMNVLKSFEDLDAALYQDVSEAALEESEREKVEAEHRKQEWDKLITLAQQDPEQPPAAPPS